MRLVSVLALLLLATPAAAQEKPGVAALFKDYGLLGEWAIDCKAKASPENPHVSVSEDTGGDIVERHDLGADYRVNAYRMLAAKRVSQTEVSVQALFDPGSDAEQKQDLTFSVHDGTRRTLFTRVEGGPVRVKNGIAVGFGAKTPRLKKCG
jgi:hypothetical protein